MENHSAQTQLNVPAAGDRAAPQGNCTGQYDQASPIAVEYGTSTNDALTSPNNVTSLPPLQQSGSADQTNGSPRPRYYSQSNGEVNGAQQTGVTGQSQDAITSHSHQYMGNQNYDEATRKANEAGMPPVQYYPQTAREAYNMKKPAPSQQQGASMPAVHNHQPTAREAYNTKKSGPGEQKWASGQPRPQNNMVMPLQGLGQDATQVDCPRCRQQVLTRTEKVAGKSATGWAVVLCLLTGICCAWIPCVIDECKDTDHYCFNCGVRLATHSAAGHTYVLVEPTTSQQATGNNKQFQQSTFVQQPQTKDASAYQQQPHNNSNTMPQADSQPLGSNSHVGPPLEISAVPAVNPNGQQMNGPGDEKREDITRGNGTSAQASDKKQGQFQTA